MPGKHHDIVADVKRLARRAAAIGVLLAVICHLLPVPYRVTCNTIAAVCQLGGGDRQ